jgi:gliding motility-associated-like protein
MKYVCLYICLLIGLNNKAQVNLIPNYSFEDTVGACQSQMGWVSCKNWGVNYIYSSPDYYNTCTNFISYPHVCTIPYNFRTYQYPRTGNAYMGLYPAYFMNATDSALIEVEYLTTILKSPLKNNGCYYAEMYANLSNGVKMATNQISMLITQPNFTIAPYSFTNTIQPQVQWDTTQYFTDTLNWVKISGTFIAQGGEQQLTIGNFKDGTHLKKTSVNSNFVNYLGGTAVPFANYILIDDVSLYELPSHTGTQSYTLCAGDSLLLGDTTTLPVRYQWSLNATVIDTASHIIVKPTQTISYVLQTKHCTTQTQTITVVVNNNCNPIIEPIIPNVFTPNGDGINDVWQYTLPKDWTLSGVEVYNRWGNLVASTSLSHQAIISWDGHTTSGEACSEGVYFYTLQYTDTNGNVHKKNGYVSLIR